LFQKTPENRIWIAVKSCCLNLSVEGFPAAKQGLKRKIILNPNVFQDITIKVLLDRYPYLLKLFMDLGFLCLGCPAEAFHTLEDVAREYGYDLDILIQHIQKTIKNNDQKNIPKKIIVLNNNNTKEVRHEGTKD